jgi:allantoin racemase
MPDLLVVNPNTTATMTQAIGAVARAAASPGTRIVARNPSRGPAVIEDPDDYKRCLAPLLEEIARGERDGCVATVIACFDDPGVTAARALVAGPVIGIAEAAIRAASMVAPRWGIVTTVPAVIPNLEGLVRRYGSEAASVGVRAAGVRVLDLEHPTDATRKRVLDTAAGLVETQGAEAIIMGCAGMSALIDDLRMLDVPVVDGVAAAVRILESLVGERTP